MSVSSPALRYHGGKFRLAPWILQHFPQHTCFVEGLGGAAGVLLQKPRSYAEVYNDLDGEIVNFFEVLQDPVSRAALIEAVMHTPYARRIFDRAWEPAEDKVERALRTAIRAQMGFGSAGATKGTTGFRTDTRRQCGTSQALWTRYPDAIAEVGERFTGVLIENRDALRVMQDHDEPTTLHFADPPYLHSVRSRHAKNGFFYRCEMNDDDHLRLLTGLLELRGMVVLCGYRSEMYDDLLTGWARHEKLARISAGRGTGLRTECLWLNPAATAARAVRPLLLF